MSKVQKKIDNFFFKKNFLKNTETTEQEQSISLRQVQKKKISPEPFAFKGFPTNTMTKNLASVSHP